MTRISQQECRGILELSRILNMSPEQMIYCDNIVVNLSYTMIAGDIILTASRKQYQNKPRPSVLFPISFQRLFCIHSFRSQNTEKRNTIISQMRLRSVFKMRVSILNTATTEQMGYDSISFFVCFPLNESNSYPCIFSIRRAVSSVSFFRELTIAVF